MVTKPISIKDAKRKFGGYVEKERTYLGRPVARLGFVTECGVITVVWQGRTGNRPPHANFSDLTPRLAKGATLAKSVVTPNASGIRDKPE